MEEFLVNFKTLMKELDGFKQRETRREREMNVLGDSILVHDNSIGTLSTQNMELHASTCGHLEPRIRLKISMIMQFRVLSLGIYSSAHAR
jgi:hypothetical protein